MPSGPCTTPVVAGDTLLFAGWSPGGPDDKEFQLPPFDAVLKQGDTNKDGAPSRAEAAKTFVQNFFDSTDADMDGKITRAEWDVVLKFMAEGKNSAFAVRAGGSGDVTKSHVLWKQTRGLPYIPSAVAYRGQYVMVKDGGIVTAYDLKTGKEVYGGRTGTTGTYYASPVAANGYIYLTSLEDGVVTVLKAGTEKLEVVARNPKLGERTAATPAIADDTLYIRTAGHLYAFTQRR
jgi:outer membrane protein assembly factor BamB